MTGYEKSPDYGSKPPTWRTPAIVVMLVVSFGLLSYAYSEPAPIRIVDADTFDIGDTRYRIKGLDAPETTMRRAECEEEKALGREAKAFAEQLTGEHRPKIKKTYGLDDFSRTLADVEINGRDWKEVFIEKGYAAAWNYDAGEVKQSWCSNDN